MVARSDRTSTDACPRPRDGRGSGARSGEVVPMAAGPGPESPDGGTPDARALAGRAWLAALPDELAAQRRVMAGLVDRCEGWPLARSLLVRRSAGRGVADAPSRLHAP